jgi:hypothetical protein
LINNLCDLSGRHHINWSESVLLSDVESTYSRFVERNNATDTAETATNYGDDESTAQKLPVVSETEESASHGQPNTDPVDDFRIRQSLSVSDLSVVVDEVSAKSRVLSSAEEATLQRDDFPSIQSIFDHLSVVFPCVLELSSGSSVDDTTKHPYVTLQPSFLKKLKNEELFLALDAAMRTFSNDGFLSKETNLEFYNNPWLERLSSQTNNDAKSMSTSLDRLPMYAIVLARIELAVFDAYHEQLQVEPSDDATSLDPLPSAVEYRNVPGAGIADDVVVVVVDDESSSSPKELATGATGHFAGSDSAKSRRSVFDMRQIENVVSYSKVLHGHTTSISASTMRKLARPFVKVCFGSKSNYHVDINHLVVMPLPWMMHARDNCQQDGRGIDFVHLDEALRGVLKALTDSASANGTTKRALKDGTVHGASDGGIRSANVGVVHGASVASNGALNEGKSPETTPFSDTLPETVDTPPANNNSKKKKKKKKKPKSKVCIHCSVFFSVFSRCSNFVFYS